MPLFPLLLINHMFLSGCCLSSLEFLTCPVVYISSSDHLSPEVKKVQLQKVQKNLSFSLQVSSCFSSFILSPWPHCQLSCILHSPTSSSSSWHCSTVSQLSLTSHCPPSPCQMLLAILFHDATAEGSLRSRKAMSSWGLPQHRFLCGSARILAVWGITSCWPSSSASYHTMWYAVTDDVGSWLSSPLKRSRKTAHRTPLSLPWSASFSTTIFSTVFLSQEFLLCEHRDNPPSHYCEPTKTTPPLENFRKSLDL